FNIMVQIAALAGLDRPSAAASHLRRPLCGGRIPLSSKQRRLAAARFALGDEQAARRRGIFEPWHKYVVDNLPPPEL
ncbi:MAG: hypothetical protein IT203_04925, partial [Fimbriimonadaceae bacterium]|nr:hypothetical protein [Fimbriimonadaceae bacterium]